MGEHRTAGALTLLRDGAMVMGGQLVARAVGFFYFMAVARTLGPEAFGFLSLALTLVVLTDVAVDLGLSRWALREAARAPDALPGLLALILPYKLAAGALAALALAGAGLALGLEGERWRVLAVSAGALVLIAPSMLLENLLQARGRFGLIASAHLTLAGLQCALGLGALALGGGAVAVAATLSAANLGYLALMASGARAAAPGFWRGPRPWRARDLAARLPAALPYLCTTLLTLVAMRAEFLLLGWFAAPAELGQFGLAARFLEAGLLLPLSLCAVLAPRFARGHAEGPQALAAAWALGLEALLVAAIAAAAAGRALAPAAAALAGGEAYAPAAPVLQALLLGFPAAAVFHLNLSLMLGAPSQRGPLIFLALVVAAQVALNLALQARFGLWGAVGASVASAALAAVATTGFALAVYVPARAAAAALAAPLGGLLALGAAWAGADAVGAADPIREGAGLGAFLLGAAAVRLVGALGARRRKVAESRK